jgi:Holliday junction resolvase
LAKLETNFWKQIKNNLTDFQWVRLESWATKGVPDVMGFTKDGKIFTVELKVTKSRSVYFSPHQIAFHVEHENSPCFILVKALSPSSPKKYGIYLFHAKQVRQIVEQGLDASARYSTLSPVDWSVVRDSLLTELDALA